MNSNKITTEEKVYLCKIFLLSLALLILSAKYSVSLINFVTESYTNTFVRIWYPDYKIGIDDLKD